MLIIYIVLSYLIHLGMIIENYSKPKFVPTTLWVSLFFSPLTLPVLIGMFIVQTKKQN